ncbi:MAG: FliH/SctL family protein [Buchnera aphidicola (Meitanaphis elongallis)]
MHQKCIVKTVWRKWYPEEIRKDANKISENNINIRNEQRNQKQEKNDESTRFVSKENNDLFLEDNQPNYTEGFFKGEKDGFIAGFDKALLEFNKKNDVLLTEMNNFLFNFEQSLIALDDVISSRLVNLALNVAKKVIETTLFYDDQSLIQKIKKILEHEKIVFHKPKLLINPSDKEIIENTFGTMFFKYKWVILYDEKVSRGGCIVFLGNTILDSTVLGRWTELCRLVLKKEES